MENAKELKEKLFFSKENGCIVLPDEELEKAAAFAEDYKAFLDAGKTADFVLLDEDPLQSFETFRRPFLVVKEGKAYKGKPGKYADVERELDKLLAK